ncbi:MAG: NAD-dependent epimerase/dehydratase family protein [Ilumatobacter sp.]|uniref:NAD-dependent epimerase/dehydratase family protein n=1 Tax=Ilumatobacter sp. TaxID=1967498 RepID=UPI00391AC7CF
MNVLVTGGSSLIGSGLTAALAERGDDVRTFQRTPPTSVHDRVEHVAGDVTDPDALAAAVDGCDAVVHLAAKVGIVGTRAEFHAINVAGTANVIAAAVGAGVSRFVHVSSPSVAHGGDSIVGGAAEPAIFDHGTAWYPATKALAEKIALEAASPTLGVVVIRPHLVWGPGDTQLVGRIVDRARTGRLALVGGGTALVDTTYIDNAVSALAAALDAVAPAAQCSGRAYVVANGEPRPIRELIEGICAAAGVDAEPRVVPLGVAKVAGSVIERVWPTLGKDEEPPLTRFLAEQLGTAHWFDQRSVRDDLDWAPSVTIDEGLRRLAAWFGEQRRTDDG